MARRDYEMTEVDLKGLLDAMKPVPYMIMGGMRPASQQENANVAWEALGRRMSFDHMTVQPNGKGDRFFTAEPSPAEASCDEQLSEAIRLATNVGYKVVPDPVHLDGEVHEPDFVAHMQPSLRALGFHAVPIPAEAEALPAGVDARATAAFLRISAQRRDVPDNVRQQMLLAASLLAALSASAPAPEERVVEGYSAAGDLSPGVPNRSDHTQRGFRP